MTALDGALALAQADHIAVLVGQHLELDVPRTLDELLHVEIAVAEGRRRFRLRCLEQCRAVPLRCGRCACRARRRRPRP